MHAGTDSLSYSLEQCEEPFCFTAHVAFLARLTVHCIELGSIASGPSRMLQFRRESSHRASCKGGNTLKLGDLGRPC